MSAHTLPGALKGALEVGYYSTTETFRAIDQHAAVMRADRSLVAVTGPSTGKGAWEALELAHLFAAAPDLHKACEALVAKFGICLNDALNPCWNNRPGDVAGKHWGVGDACPVCIARAALAKAEGR